MALAKAPHDAAARGARWPPRLSAAARLDIALLVEQLAARPLWALLERALARLPGRPFGITRFYVLELGAPPRAGRVAAEGFAVRAATRADLAELARLEQKPAGRLAVRFDRGDYALCAVSGGEIVGYEWFSEQPFFLEEKTGYTFEIPGDGVYAYDAFVALVWRGRGVLGALQTAVRDLMPRRGRSRVLSMIQHDNRVSLTAHLRLGFRVARRLLVLTALGRALAFAVGPGGPSPGYGLSPLRQYAGRP
ncbi:MAG TPA: hypothetical protein VGQ83_19515 [Polyangia bacterium]|jgi:GNAT superfamily N-acetyltransferase